MLCLCLPCISPFAQRFNAHIYVTKDVASRHPTNCQFRLRCLPCLLRALWESSLASGFAGIESSSEGKLGGNTFDAVSRVYVLDQCNLVAGCGTLTGDDSGVGKEEFPDLCIISLSTTQQISRHSLCTIYCHTSPRPSQSWRSSFCTISKGLPSNEHQWYQFV